MIFCFSTGCETHTATQASGEETGRTSKKVNLKNININININISININININISMTLLCSPHQTVPSIEIISPGVNTREALEGTSAAPADNTDLQMLEITLK